MCPRTSLIAQELLSHKCSPDCVSSPVGSMVGLMTLKVRSGSVSVGSLGSGVHKVLFEPFKGLWWVWGLNLNVIFPSYNLVGASPLPLDIEYLFGVIQHSAVDAFSAVNCNFGVLAEEDEHMSFYSAILENYKTS